MQNLFRYRLTIQYDGTSYHGWQIQPDCITIQGKLTEVITSLFGTKNNFISEIYGSGRTDAGVHALGQVAHFDCNRQYGASVILRAMNSRLHGDQILVTHCEEVSQEFHARFSATQREYKYIIYISKLRPIFVSSHGWWLKHELNLDNMKKASQYLIGKHDFSSFRSSECQAKSPIKTLSNIDIKMEDIILYNMPLKKIVIQLFAPSFLHHQVRNIVGTLYDFGRNQILDPKDMQYILKQKSRGAAGRTAPASGLYLFQVKY